MNQLPHVIIRSMSDKANGEAPDSFEAFTQVFSITSVAIVAAMLKDWADDSV
ncbi:hypothetical protein [Saccharibacillus sacchari]|uniref:Uncharacterized protein n=1 Tax=Saccharibacillus sacchari TaxID=456493 RepID=A0ACC6PBV9_9BACL